MHQTHRVIETILFYTAEPQTVDALCSMLSLTRDQVEKGIHDLKKRLIDSGSGISVIRHNDTVELRTHSDFGTLIEQIRKDELTRDIGKAGLETVAILLYLGNSTRSDIDYIRGVNSSFILRNLVMRGLVTRVEHPTDQRTHLYSLTTDALAHLGITSSEQLPDFEKIRQTLRKTLDEQNDTEEVSTTTAESPQV